MRHSRGEYISSPNKGDISLAMSSHYDQSQGNIVSPHNPVNNQNRVKEIISTTQNTFEKLKRELSDKNQTIEEKNREILKLKI